MKYTSLAFMTWRLILGKIGQKHDLAKKAVRGAIMSVAISMIPLVVVFHIANGMMYGIIQRFIELDSYHIQLQPVGNHKFSQEEIEKLVTLDHIVYAQPEIRSFGMLFANSRYEGVAIRAVTNDFFSEHTIQQFLQTKANRLQFDSSKDIIVGEALANKLSLKIGDTVTLITTTQSTYDNFFPKFSLFVVKDIVSSGYQPLDGQWVFINELAAQKIVSHNNRQVLIGIKTDIPSNDLESIETAIAETIPGTYRIYDWKQLNKTMNDSLQSTRTLLVIIMSITVLVAAINILSSLRMMILEKSMEFAILQCIGIKPYEFAGFLFFAGCIIGLIGSVIGIIPGILISSFINEIFKGIGILINVAKMLFGYSAQTAALLDPTYYLDYIPITILWKEILMIVAITALLSGLVSITSVHEIVRKKPIETIRQR